MKKILCIGNSFSQDATRYLEAIAEGELLVRNCYIGGCSLQRHATNIENDAAEYDYEKDAVKVQEEKVALSDALTRENWDYVTVQQVSTWSGVYDSYEPHMREVIAYVKEKCPKAKIVFHRTWPYEDNSKHGSFPKYGCDRDAMFEAIERVTDRVATHYGIPIIAAGDAVYRIGKLPEFNAFKGGISLYRDDHHLGLDYGRYLAGLVWYRFFTGKSAETVTFAPKGTDPDKIAKLKSLVG